MSLIEIDDNLTLLVGLLVPFLVLFVFAFALDEMKLWLPAMFCVIVITGIIVVLIRWRGDEDDENTN